MNIIEKLKIDRQLSLMYANHCNSIDKPADYTNA